MRKNRTRQRLTAMMLSVILIVGMMPVSALAETGSFPIGASGEVTAFEALGSDITVRSVPLGTSKAELELPDTLTATLRIAAFEEEPVLDSGETDTELDNADTVSGSAIGKDEITVPLPVTWTSSPEYDGDAAGTYIFTLELPGGLTLASGVEVHPAITVTVGAVTIIGTVTAFEELPENVRWQNTTAPEFPETVSGTVEGETAQIPVTWDTEQDYDAENPQRGLYVFTAVFGKGYEIGDGIELPRITLYITQTVGRMMMRMVGGGASDSPLEITTAAQLAEIATLVNARPNGLELFLLNDTGAKVSLKLMNDIDLSAYTNGEGWVPIGGASNQFKGTFDGGGNRITGLYINRDEHVQGLFGCIGSGGTIRNIGVENVNITGGNYVGGVVGYSNGMVENCYSAGTISGAIGIGGVVGHVYSGTVQNCYNTGTVLGTANVGGVVGTASDGTLINCFSTGTVSGTDDIGGVLGYLSNGMMQNCAALNPSVSGTNKVRRVAGHTDGGTLSGNIAFADMLVTQNGSVKTPVEGANQVEGESKTATDIRAEGFFETLFGNDAAWIYTKGRLPILVGLSGQNAALPAYIAGFTGTGASGDPYRIHTAADLRYMAEIFKSGGDSSVKTYYRLENDIDLSVYGEDYDGGKGWMPIRSFTNSEFDGNGKTITGLYINRSNIGNIGLFGRITESTIKNLFLEGISLHKSVTLSGGHIGGIAGHVDGGSTISGCAVRGFVTGEETPSSHGIGGLVGLLEQSSTLEKCVFYGTVSAKDDGVYGTSESPASVFAGGIVGFLSQANVFECISVAYVSATGENAYAGGIAGQADSGARLIMNASLCAVVYADAASGRIAGVITPSASGLLNNKNFAWNGMVVNNREPNKAESINGADVDSDAIQTLWTSGALWGWDTSSWTLAQGKLPMLKGLSNQNDVLPFYIVRLLGTGETADNPLEINDAATLITIINEIEAGQYFFSSAHYKLMADIDLSPLLRDQNWTPFGSIRNPFKGTFDGNGHRIFNLNIDTMEDFQGLFGFVSKGTIKNLGVINVHIRSGGDYTGGLVGGINGGTVQNCYVTGEVNGDRMVGGVVGQMYESIVEYCYSTAAISGTNSVGGIVGDVYIGSTLRNCVAMNHGISVSRPTITDGRVASLMIGVGAKNNYAYSGIPGTWTNKGKDKRDGNDITSQALFDASFWTTADNWYDKPWDSSVWTFEDNKLPTFKGHEGQDGESGLYHTVRDIQYATVTPDTTSFIYNGNQQVPNLTISFDGLTLKKDTDYTVSITSTDGSGTSGGTNAGTVTLTVIGIGNFRGIKSFSYIIGKRMEQIYTVTFNPNGDTPPAPDKPNSPTQGEIKVPGTVDSKGNVNVNITEKTVTDAFDKALAKAKKNGTEQNGIMVVLRVNTGSKTGTNVMVNLPKTVQATIIGNKIVSVIVVVDNPNIRICMDLATVKEINKQAKSDVNITATRADRGKLTTESKKAIGNRPVFDLKVNYGSGKQVQNFGSGSVTVTIPYTLDANEKAGNVQAVYVDAKGKVHWLTNSVYDSVEKVLRFSTSHFSTFGIGYKQINTAFKDIAGHWAKEDIEFVVSRGLFSGTSKTTFSPNTAMTRGRFVAALGRLANADVSGYTKSSYSDVKNDAYYMGYIEWASKNSILSGVGNGTFAPDQSITREQMAVIMSNYAKTIGYILPKVHVENTFADNGKISTYAKEAVKQMQMAGVISGKNRNLFDPQGTSTRAEVSAVLRRFEELAISSDTMQGWTRNDSGKWMYYENGKTVTGKKEIEGSTYTFDQYGVTADVPKNLK